MVGDSLETVGSNSRRTNASSVHIVGGSTGATGAPAAYGFNTALTRLATMPGAAPTGSGRVAAVGAACMVTTALCLASVHDGAAANGLSAPSGSETGLALSC